MSQLDRIEALLADADDTTLLKVRDKINDQLGGNDTSGEGVTPDSADPDSNATDANVYQNARAEAEESPPDNPDSVPLDAGDGTPDGTYPTTQVTESTDHKSDETSPEDKLIHNDPS